MPLLPVAASRTSAPLSTQRLLFQLNADQLAIQRQLDQLSTGRRVLRMSDDPAAAGRAIGIQRGIDRTEQLTRNADSTARLYQSTDSALARLDDALIQARGTTVQASQSVISPDERESLAITLRQTLEAAFSAGSSIFRDQQLLGGSLDVMDLLRWDDGQIVFDGRDAIGQTKIGSGDPLAINVGGNQSLGVRSVVRSGEILDPGLVPRTRLPDLNSGDGVTPGVLRISDGNEWQTVDLRHAATIGDVKELLEAIDLDGRSLTATISSDTFRIEYSDGLAGTLAIADAEGSRMAKELGIENPSGLQPPPLETDPLTPRVNAATRLADLAGGAGIDVSDGIRIRQGEKTFQVDLSEAETIADVIDAINRSGADVAAELDRSVGRLQIRALRSGVDYSIGENGGTAATDLGIRSATGQTTLAELGRGGGVELSPSGPDLVITRPDGVVLELEIDGAETVDDVIGLIRNHPQNQDASRVLVDLNEFGNGIQIDAPPGADPLRIEQTLRSNAGERLGLIPAGQDSVEGVTNGSVDSVIGDDFLPREPADTFDTLLRLETAVRGGDFAEMERLLERLDVDFNRASRARGRVGIWTQNLETLRDVANDDVVALKSQLSDEVDADLATVISDLTQRQVAMEASLNLIGRSAQLTVLNFL